jgi:alcohol dehydrogenase YqhD (iron-dependent ADH family)
MAAPGETYHPAFPYQSKPHISTGLPFPVTCAHHISNTYHASRAYIIVSNSISQTAAFADLQKALGDRIVGVRKGIKPHTPWDDVLEIIQDVRDKAADIIITLGAGSLTDGAKLISYVSNTVFSSQSPPDPPLPPRTDPPAGSCQQRLQP